MSDTQEHASEMTPEKREKLLCRLDHVWGKVTSTEDGEAINAFKHVRRCLQILGISFHDWLGEKMDAGPANQEQLDALTERLIEFAEANEELKAGEQVLLDEVRCLTDMIRHFRPKPEALEVFDIATVSPLLIEMIQKLEQLAEPVHLSGDRREDLATYYQAQVGAALQASSASPPKPGIVAGGLLTMLRVLGYPYPHTELEKLRQLTSAQAAALDQASDLNKDAAELGKALPALQDTLDLLLENSGDPVNTGNLMNKLLRMQAKVDEAERIAEEARQRADLAKLELVNAKNMADSALKRANEYQGKHDTLVQEMATGKEDCNPYGAPGTIRNEVWFNFYRTGYNQRWRELDVIHKINDRLNAEKFELAAELASGEPLIAQISNFQDKLSETEMAVSTSADVLANFRNAHKEERITSLWHSLACGGGAAGMVFFIGQTLLGGAPIALASVASGLAVGLFSHAFLSRRVDKQVGNPLRECSQSFDHLAAVLKEATGIAETAVSQVEGKRTDFLQQSSTLITAFEEAARELDEKRTQLEQQELRNVETLAEIAIAKAELEAMRNDMILKTKPQLAQNDSAPN